MHIYINDDRENAKAPILEITLFLKEEKSIYKILKYTYLYQGWGLSKSYKYHFNTNA